MADADPGATLPAPSGEPRQRGRGRGIPRGGRLLLGAALALVLSCAAPSGVPPWSSGEAVVLPDPQQGSGDPGPRGYLVVETELTGIQMGGIAQRYRFFVYDAQGRYLDDYPNDRLSSISLPAGNYVVVSRCRFGHRRVQVLVRPGLLTTVRAQDLEQAREIP